MPTVPTYNRKVQEAPLPGVRGTPDISGAAFGIGGGVQAASDKFANIAMGIMAQEKKNADKLAVLEADKTMSEVENDLLHNKDTGAFNRRGKAALGIEGDTMGLHTKKANELMKNMTVDQKSQFKAIMISRQKDLSRQLLKHEATEIDKWDQSVTEVFLKNERDAATTHYDSPEMIAKSIERSNEALRGRGERVGLDKEVIKRLMFENESKIHKNIINKHLSNEQDLLAQGYYSEVKDKITTDDKAAIGKAMLEGSRRGRASRLTGKILNKAKGLGDALNMAGEIKDNKVKELVKKEIRQVHKDSKAAKEDIQNNLYEGSVRYMNDNPGKLPPPGIYSSLSPEDQDALKRKLINPVTEQKAWIEYTTMTPDKIAALSNREYDSKYYSKFSKADKSAANKMRNEAKSGKNQTSTLSWKTRLENTFRQSKFLSGADANKSTSKWKGDTRQRFIDLQRKAANQLRLFEDTKGKKANGEEQQKILDDLLMTVWIDKPWSFDPKLPTMEVEEDQLGNVYVPIGELTRKEIANIEVLLDKWGILQGGRNNEIRQKIGGFGRMRDSEGLQKYMEALKYGTR